MRLIVITPEGSIPGEIALVNLLFQHGLQTLHVRKPAYTEQEYRDFICSVDAGNRKRLVITNYLHLITEYELSGLHLNSFMRTEALLSDKETYDDGHSVSGSFHSWAEIEENNMKLSYVFISPVFDSISKKGYKAAIDLSAAQTVKRNLNERCSFCPQIIGLGGVDAHTIRVLAAHGFDGAAVLGAIWNHPDPLSAFIAIQGAIG